MFVVEHRPRLVTGQEESYKDHAGFVVAVRKATREMVDERLLLEEGAVRYVKAVEESNVLR